MFDAAVDGLDQRGGPDVSGMSAAQLAAECVVDTHRLLQHAGCQMLQLAAAWADSHPKLNPQLNEFGRPCPGSDRGRVFGAESNPEASEFCPIEFGALQATSTVSAALLIADALDLRQRLPLIWQRVEAGEVNPAKARRVAQATRALSEEAAGLVDRGIVDHLDTLPWTRFLLVLSALVIQADPHAAEMKAKAAEADRFVRAAETNAAGLKLLIAQANAGDVLSFMGMVNRIADILAVEGDADPVDVRRSKAIGILAQPAHALHLLLAHQGDTSRNTARITRKKAQQEPPPTDDLAAVERRFTGAELTEMAATELAVLADDLASARVDAQDPDSADWSRSALAACTEEPVDESSLPADPAAEIDTYDTVALDNFGVDYRRLRPTATLYVHITDHALATGKGVARLADVGPVTVEQIRRFLGSAAAGYDIRVEPVLDPVDVAPVDSYEIPLRLREAVLARNPADVYPLRELYQSANGSGPHAPLHPDRQGRAAGPDQPGQPRPAGPYPPSRQNPRPRQPATTRSGHLSVPIAAGLGLPDNQPRHAQPGQHRLRPPHVGPSRTMDAHRLADRLAHASVADYPSPEQPDHD